MIFDVQIHVNTVLDMIIYKVLSSLTFTHQWLGVD